MVITPTTALLIAIAAALLVAAAEWLHARRIARVSRLAFGPDNQPAGWTRVVPSLRTLATACTVWGLLMLATLDPQIKTDQAVREASRHLLIAFDASPSMHLQDAGPESTKLSRSIWGGKLVQGVLDRLDPATTRTSLVAIYSDAFPIFRESFDKEVIRNAMDGLPLYAAFHPGPTKLAEGVAKAIEVAKPWLPGSATLIVVSDGDTITAGVRPRLPASIADTIVIGVGDPHHASPVGGHQSRQDMTALKQLAVRLGGTYHQGNTHHIPTEILDALSMIQPRLGDRGGLRELAILTAVGGAATLGLIPVALGGLGYRRSWVRARRGVLAGGSA
ncbi:MAG TPA: hypothetical protein QF800_01065 [Phycisphaerales bacterium]|nr:hypothetical protein [Phycisphaerales bacterium]